MSKLDIRSTTLSLTVLAAAVVLTACENPANMEVEQLGYRGVGMEQVTNRNLSAAAMAANMAPEITPPVTPAGPRAGDLYENVQVLGDLTITEFNRLMTALTAWVSPDEGCNYCHVPGDFASEDIYTKAVSRRMLEMTKTINEQWHSHVADTGVTCYTCHQGKPVPEYIWFAEQPAPQAGGMAASRAGQNLASAAVGYASLPSDPFTPFLLGEEEIRIIPTTVLPEGSNPRNIMDTEWTYSLMFHFSESLGVNCTFCHNSRSFFSWDGSPPQRVAAWHGIRMMRELNQDYLDPLQSVYPDIRLGPAGDAPKANCQTCHQGVNKPLNGAAMLQHYPELMAVSRAAARDEARNGGMAAVEAEPVEEDGADVIEDADDTSMDITEDAPGDVVGEEL
jgi:photosynthetic reaction center cytochrome c subunit